MKSKNYSVTVLSSLLATLSCSAEGLKKDEPRPAEYGAFDEERADLKKEERFDSNMLKIEELDTGSSGAFVAEDGAEAFSEEEGLDDPDCSKGSMYFEGECVDKGKVSMILEDRERKALKRVRQAEKPEETIHAAGDLLEKQIAQVDKAEHDLDEIIEELKEEKAARAEAAKEER